MNTLLPDDDNGENSSDERCHDYYKDNWREKIQDLVIGSRKKQWF
jgi:hypothetical protein